jgi:uncharacterized membrane protein
VHKARLEAFSDGVIAIIITIMVLEMHAPAGASWEALRAMVPSLVSYVLSFTFLGIYWNNHHHMLQATKQVNGPILWANLHLLFWLSLTPVVTAWVAQTHFAPLPVAVYGVVLLLSGVAYNILTIALIAHHGQDSLLAKAIGDDVKGRVSLAAYLIAIPLAFWYRWAACALYVIVAIIWLVPDRRIERVLAEHG